jgi:cytochrome c-type biogenesis protein CcmI
MIWVAGICLLLGVLLIVVTPLLGSADSPSFKKALQEQKTRIADDLAALGSARKAGEISEDDFLTQQRILETEAVSLLEAEKKATQAAPVESKDRRLAKMLAAALALVLTADVAAGVYLYKGGWAQLLHGDMAIAPHAGAGGEAGEGGEGGPMMGGNGQNVDPNAMVNRLEEKLKANPDDAKGQAMLARSYQVMNRFEDSIPHYQKAVELEPENQQYRVGLGMSLVRTRDMAGAKKEFATVLKAEPANTDALWFMGMLQAYAKDWASAEKTWNKLVAAVPAEEKAGVKEQIAKVTAAIKKDHADHPDE